MQSSDTVVVLLKPPPSAVRIVFDFSLTIHQGHWIGLFERIPASGLKNMIGLYFGREGLNFLPLLPNIFFLRVLE